MGGPAAQSPELVLVDGYNLLHAVPRFAPRGGDVALGRASLEAWLLAEALLRRVRRVVLVWDGRGSGATGRSGPLVIEETPAGTTADSRILDLARQAGSARDTWIVSSDADVAVPARQMGFTVLGTMSFYRRWASLDAPAGATARRLARGGGGRPSAPDPERETKPSPSRRDVERMLRELAGPDDHEDV